MERSEILDFVRKMRATEHVIMFYSEPEDEHLVLFTYLKAGLDGGEAAAYVTSQGSTDEVRQAMRRFGIDVEQLERTGALRVIDCKDWYFAGERFSLARTLKLWKRLYDESVARGFKGLRVTGDAAHFFERKMVRELLEYEKALHRTLEMPMTAICAYDANVVAKEGSGELYLDLIKAHRTVIFTGLGGGLIKSY